MTEELRSIIAEWRDKGVQISDEEAEDILQFCKRKMDICRIQNQEEYLPILYRDEVKNCLFRCSVNATTMLRKMKEEGVCAVCV